MGVSLSLPCSDALSNALKPNKVRRHAYLIKSVPIRKKNSFTHFSLSTYCLHQSNYWYLNKLQLTIAKIHYSSNLVNSGYIFDLTIQTSQYLVPVPASSPIFQGMLDLPVLLNIAGCQSVCRCKFYTPVVPACPSTSDDRHYQRRTTPGLKSFGD